MNKYKSIGNNTPVNKRKTKWDVRFSPNHIRYTITSQECFLVLISFSFIRKQDLLTLASTLMEQRFCQDFSISGSSVTLLGVDERLAEYAELSATVAESLQELGYDAVCVDD